MALDSRVPTFLPFCTNVPLALKRPYNEAPLARPCISAILRRRPSFSPPSINPCLPLTNSKATRYFRYGTRSTDSFGRESRTTAHHYSIFHIRCALYFFSRAISKSN
ncbi:hypothetical protein EUGRSUZ_H00076 [Eucalyptus grandis]|uniref:Uncharacterized protein n=2 Tax=Eucalyptus grandis TaxID=71139 RepID=A0ACC3JKG6_EUCGR|nr:hypothetical protein EUGRSUZ_H00076 [Eucalyptus grandis]